METLKAVDKETLARIGQAYLICSKYPEVFGGVKLEKLCSLFVDELDEEEDEHEARMRKYAPEMYRVLKDIRTWGEEKEINNEQEDRLYEEMCAVLNEIDGGEPRDE